MVEGKGRVRNGAQRNRRCCRVQKDVLGEIERLDPICRAPPQELHERAGACEQCHGDNGMPGLVCAHCELECQVVRWEARLFRFTARALGVGAMVSEEQALEVYRQELLRGGAAAGAAPPPAQRAKTGIASVAMTHQDNEHVVLLQAVVTLLRCGPCSQQPIYCATAYC